MHKNVHVRTAYLDSEFRYELKMCEKKGLSTGEKISSP